MFFGLKGKKPNVLFLIDFENLLISATSTSPDRFSIKDGLERAFQKIGETGEIIAVFVFMPSVTAQVWEKDLAKIRVNGKKMIIIACPADESGQDTTDSVLTETGELLIETMSGLTHLCLGSGDADFIGLLEKAGQKGLKRMILAANRKSLSRELSFLADKTSSSEVMIYYFF